MTDSPEGPARAALASAWAAAWAGREGNGFHRCCAEDLHYEDPLTVSPLLGAAALEQHAERVRAALPDMRVEAAGRAVFDGSRACLSWRLLGTHRGEGAGLPPTGRFLVLPGVHYLELAGHEVRRARGFFDLYDVGVQLGALPARGSLAETALLLVRGFGLRPKA